MPQARVLTSTCPEAGFGSGTLPTTISPFLKMAARNLFPPDVPLIVFTSRAARPCVNSNDGGRHSYVWADRDGSGVRRQLAIHSQQLRAPDPLAVSGIKTAGDNEYGASNGPDIR